MPTLQNMIDRIADEMKRDDVGDTASDAVASIRNAVQDAIYHYQRESLFSQEGIDTSITTVDGTHSYNAPTTLTSILAVTVTASSQIWTLEEELWQVIDEWDSYSTPRKETPQKYAFFNQQFRFWPTPNGAYPVRIIGYFGIAVPGLSANNFWTDEGGELIRHRAKYLLHTGVFRDVEAATLDKRLEQETFQNLLIENARKLHTGKLKPWPRRRW